MARQTILQIWCDVCQDKDLSTPGEELPSIQIGNMKPRTPALCEPHKKEFYDPFFEILQFAAYTESLGATAPKARSVQSGGRDRLDASGGRVACPFPGCDHVSANRDALPGHTWGQHETRLPELLKDGKLYDLDGEVVWELKPAPQGITEWKCKRKGCEVEYTYPGNPRPAQAGAVHMRNVHGVKTPRSKE